MAKTRCNLGKEILEGIREIKRGEHGRVSNLPSVASIRESTGLSQSRFAELLGVSVRTLQEWERAAERRSAHAAAHRGDQSARPQAGGVRTRTIPYAEDRELGWSTVRNVELLSLAESRRAAAIRAVYHWLGERDRIRRRRSTRGRVRRPRGGRVDLY